MTYLFTSALNFVNINFIAIINGIYLSRVHIKTIKIIEIHLKRRNKENTNHSTYFLLPILLTTAII